MTFNEFKFTPEDVYKELKKRNVDIELNDKYKYLENSINFIDLDEVYGDEKITFEENEIEDYLREKGYIE